MQLGISIVVKNTVHLQSRELEAAFLGELALLLPSAGLVWRTRERERCFLDALRLNARLFVPEGLEVVKASSSAPVSLEDLVGMQGEDEEAVGAEWSSE